MALSVSFVLCWASKKAKTCYEYLRF